MALVACVIAAGIVLRLVALLRSAVEHFDEGVYASNIYFGAPEYAYPQQKFYAPPLLPALIEAGMILGLPPNVAALLPSFLAGCATIVAVWWFGRTWFGSEVGLSAAALVALSDFHILYSASALTDALLGLWLVLAVDAIARSLLAGDFRWAVAAGIYTGLAWWTKYNGWLPLAVEAAALPLLWLLIRPPSKQPQTWLACFLATALVAALIWAPYYLSLQSHGGYRPVAENHAKYVVGLSGWFDSAARQFSNQIVLEGIAGKLAIVGSLILPTFLGRRNLREIVWIVLHGLAAGMLSLMVTAFLLVTAGAVIGFARVIRDVLREPDLNANNRYWVGLAVVVAMWCGLFVATPCYAPYPRLLLPWCLATWLGMAMNLAVVVRWHDNKSDGQWWPQWSWRTVGILGLVLGIGLFLNLSVPHAENMFPNLNRTGLRRIASQVRATSDSQPRVVYVFGEPALFFQLRAAGEEIVAPVQEVPRQAATIDGKAVPTFLIVGPHSRGDSQFQQQWTTAQDRFELVKTFEYEPSAIVWLDLHDPRKAAPDPGSHAVRLYRLRS